MSNFKLQYRPCVQRVEKESQRVTNDFDVSEETAYAMIDDIPIVGDKEEFIDLTVSLPDNAISKRIKILKEHHWLRTFAERLTSEQLADFLIRCGIGKGFDEAELIDIITSKSRRKRKAIDLNLNALVEYMKVELPKLENSQKQRNERGEHVINNGVLSKYKRRVF